MNIRVKLKMDSMKKEDVRKLIDDVEIFCSCGLRLHGVDFNTSEECPECGREFHLQDGVGHFHIIVNKPSEGNKVFRNL